MKTVKTIWVPGLSHLHRPKDLNRKMVLALWLITTALLAFWLGCMAANYLMSGWIHFLLVAFVAMAIFTFAYGLKHDEYYERPLQRHRKGKWQFRKTQPAAQPPLTNEPIPEGGKSAT